MNKRTNKPWLVPIIPLAASAALVMRAASPVAAAALPATAAPGEVVQLSGTPNLWVVDGQGMAHFASDPQALADKPVNWSSQIEVTRDQLAGMQRGTPWLSMSLVRIGSAIYLPEMGATGTSAPALFHIQSPDDLWLLGITTDNYGQLVLDQATWEQRYGVSLSQAPVAGDFEVTPPAPAPSDSDSEGDSSSDSGNDVTGDVAP